MFDPNKPVQTRDGRPARIICTDRKLIHRNYNIIALITESNGEEVVYSFNTEGEYSIGVEKAIDLINIPETKTVYLNIYPPSDEGAMDEGAMYEGAFYWHKDKSVALDCIGFDGFTIALTYEDDVPTHVEIVK